MKIIKHYIKMMGYMFRAVMYDPLIDLGLDERLKLNRADYDNWIECIVGVGFIMILSLLDLHLMIYRIIILYYVVRYLIKDIRDERLI